MRVRQNAPRADPWLPARFLFPGEKVTDVIPAFRIGGSHALVIFLYVFVIFGTLHLFALANPQTKFAKTLFALGF